MVSSPLFFRKWPASRKKLQIWHNKLNKNLIEALSLKYRTLRDYLTIIAGSAIMALGMVWFLIPNRIAAGGVSGLATVIFYLAGLPVGLVMLIINIPLWLFSIRELGWKSAIRTLAGAAIFSVLTDLFGLFLQEPLTNDPLLAALYGGVLIGIGLGFIFRVRGSTGGTALAAQLLHRLTGVSLGKGLFIFDVAVIIIAGFAFNPELALYGALSLFATSYIIDLIQEGVAASKAALIISNHNAAISQAVLEDLDRGATALHGRGLYTGTDRDILLSVVARSELNHLKEIVYRIDPQAFVIVADVREVLGEGFKRIEK